MFVYLPIPVDSCRFLIEACIEMDVKELFKRGCKRDIVSRRVLHWESEGFLRKPEEILLYNP